MPIRLTDRLRRGLGLRSSGVDPSRRLLPPLRSPTREAVPPAATGAIVSLRRLGERCAGPATIVAAVAIGAVWLAALVALDREPPSPPLEPARAAHEAAIGGDAQRLRSVPELPARIAPERRHVKRKHERRRPRRAAAAVVIPRATAPPVATATPQPVVASPTPSAAPPPVQTTPAPAPARPEPERDDSGQTFDLSG
jgi:hypothetical protein